MRISVQTDDFRLFKEAVSSNCDSVRFGSEFCELTMPSLGVLEKAYDLARERGKKFKYITPRLSNVGIKKLRKHLIFLKGKGEVDIIVNDLGALNVIKDYQDLRPCLGRHLIMVPARSPWTDRMVQSEEPFSKRWISKLFSSINLSYKTTIELYRSCGIQNADVDWIPRIFPSFDFLVENGLSLSVHLLLVPVTFTRKCHMARFLGEKSPEECSKPCLRRAFLLKNEVLGLELFLQGNAVFRLVQPSSEDINDLKKGKVTEFVLTMNPITKIDTAQKINGFILDLNV